MRKFLGSFLLIVMFFSLASAQKKKDINTPVTVSYCLPKTSFQVRVKFEYTQLIPGPYRQFAEKELGIKPEIVTKGEQWKIKSIEVKGVPVQDPNAMYNITSSLEYRPVMLSLSPEGFLAGVAAGPMGLIAREQVMKYEVAEQSPDNEVDITSLNTYNPLKEVLDTNYTLQEVDGVMKKIWDPIVRYTPKSGNDNMTEVVREIFRIRSERTKLVGAENEVPDGSSLDVILREFDRMESDYLSLFMGKRITSTVERVFMCTPEKAGEAVIAFRFSESDGVAERKNVSAVPYSLQVDNISVAAGSENVPGTQAAIFYRVPAVGTIKLLRASEELQSFQAVIPQLGVIKAFPVDIIGNEGLTLEFYPEYGAIKSVNKK